ncbi:MAG TPA: hypothetical protein VF785_23825 [Gemmatimonadaceae bacterium]
MVLLIILKHRWRWCAIRSTAVMLLPSFTASCRWTKTIHGGVTDYDARTPLAGVAVFANQSGWGTSRGTLVWDKEYRYRAQSGPTGDFVLQYRVGDVARLAVDLEGYNHYADYAAPGERVDIRLKRLPPPHPRLPGGQLRFGLKKDGTRYGWAFDRGTIGSSCAEADVIPERVDEDPRGQILISACGRGGLRFIPAESLGVQTDFLVYADTAPEDGYAGRLLLNFSGRGGIVFVRTRDGMHYAKFAFQPRAFGSFLDPDVKRDAAFGYVFDPGGSRYLPFEIAPRIP